MATATILIVDDEEHNRRLLEVLLQPEGYTTMMASDGRGGSGRRRRHSPDLILLDVMMPGMDGYQVAAILKADPATESIPIIMVTAQRRPRRRACWHSTAGAEEFLTKPVDRAELWLRVRNLLRLKEYGDFLARPQRRSGTARSQERTADLQRFRTGDGRHRRRDLPDQRDDDEVRRGQRHRLDACSATPARSCSLSVRATSALDVESDPEQTFDDADRAGDPVNTLHKTVLRAQGRHRLPRRGAAATPASSGDDWIIVGVVRDITERKEAEERLQHLAHFDDAHRPAEPQPVLRDADELAEPGAAEDRMGAWRCCSSTSTTSRTSTTRWATPSATSCCASSPAAWSTACACATPSAASAATSSRLILTHGGRRARSAIAVADKIREALREPFDLQEATR